MEIEWQPPADISPWMVCAANRANGHIVCSARHFDKVMHDQIRSLKHDLYRDYSEWDWEQGFIDQWGRFYTREQAMECVKNSGQRFMMDRNGNQDKELFSEGLY